jgi:hypothetical protein
LVGYRLSVLRSQGLTRSVIARGNNEVIHHFLILLSSLRSLTSIANIHAANPNNTTLTTAMTVLIFPLANMVSSNHEGAPSAAKLLAGNASNTKVNRLMSDFLIEQSG